MTFPVVETTATSSEASNTSSHTVSLPASIQAGDLLVAFFAVDGNPTVTWPNEGTDWIQFHDTSSNPSGRVRFSTAWRAADGLEGGSITVSTSNTQQSAHGVVRISGAEDPATQAPEIDVIARGTSTTPNPLTVTPTGGAKDYLFLAAFASDRNRTVDGFPSNMATGPELLVNGSSNNAVSFGFDADAENATSFNPDTFLISASDEWIATTVAVHPGAGTVVTKTATLNAILQELGKTRVATLNARVQETFTKSATFNARLAINVLKTATLNSLVAIIGATRTATFNARLLTLGKTVTVTLNAVAVAVVTKSATLNGMLQALGLTRTATFSAVVQDQGKTVTATFSGNAQATNTEAATLNAVLELLGATRTATLDARLQERGKVRTLTLNSRLLQLGKTVTATFSGFLSSVTVVTKTATLNSVLRENGKVVQATFNAQIGAAAPGGYPFADLHANRVKAKKQEDHLHDF